MGYTKVIQSGNIIEVYEYSGNLTQRKKRKRESYIRRARSTSRRGDNVNRLQKNFVRLVRSNLTGSECPAFFTLTVAEVVRVELGYRFFTEFISRLRRVFGKHFKYIAVPEFQVRGAIHFHVLFWGFKKEVIENEVPSVKTFGEGGNIKLGEVKRGSRFFQRLWQRGTVDCFLTDGSPKLASYVSKYMSKALFDDRLLAQKAYICSRNVMRSVSLKTSTVLNFASGIWGIDLKKPVVEKHFDTHWLGKGRYRLYDMGVDKSVDPVVDNKNDSDTLLVH